VILPIRVSNFELREVVASGGMGTVYRAFDVKLERNVAVKLLKKEMAADKQVLDSFYREARAAAALNHTNIIHIYAFDEYNGVPYLVMELADNGSLDQRIERERQVPELHALDVGVKITNALDSALRHDLLHRDIKPGNILYDSVGEPKLVDFGLARKAEDQEDQGSDVWGTPYYVAPEKITREGETFHSDMYSLGATLYHALTGCVPFDAKTVQEVVSGHVHTPLTPPNRVRPDITQETSDALMIAMAKKPQDRFPSYGDFQMALERSRTLYLFADQNRQQATEKKGTRRFWWKS
jgi:serine/threonine protein kinase